MFGLWTSLTWQETRYVHDSMNRQKWNLLLIFTFYIISQVSIFKFHLIWLVFQIFWIKSDITEVLEQPNAKFPCLTSW